MGTCTLDRRREGSPAPTNETPDCSVKHTLCGGGGGAHTQESNEKKNKREMQTMSRCLRSEQVEVMAR